MVSIYYYSAVWCIPCKTKPIFDEVTKDLDNVEIVRIDVDHMENGESVNRAIKHKVMSIPTLVKEIDGVVVNRFVGPVSQPELEAFIGV